MGESCVRCAATPYHHGLTCEEEALREALVRKCPGCQAPIERMDSCVHMTCPGCSYEFSWVCGCAWQTCRDSHRCTRRGIYLPEILHPVVQRFRSEGEVLVDVEDMSEDIASDVFLELRCIYLLSKLLREVPLTAWAQTKRDCPQLLRRVIRGHRSISWSHIGDERRLQRLRRALPEAFPAFEG